jgi:predicted nucleic acid-binding protein
LILVDTNVLIDIATNDPRWAAWSERQLEAASTNDELGINSVIYAEFSIGFIRIEEVNAFLGAAEIGVLEIPRAALFLAGKVFRAYRSRAGVKSGVLPDFFIGAHAAMIGATLLTRDVGRYRTYFPKLPLIMPDD